MKNSTKTCKSCINRFYCWERSREYPCRDFKDMYSPKKDEKENKK